MPSSKTIAKGKYLLYLQTLKTQIPVVILILLFELFVRSMENGGSIIVIGLLGVMIYAALSAGQKQGLIAAILVILYTYHMIISDSNNVAWLSFETFRRGIVIAITFPVLAFVIGRLKERNDALLLREQSAREEAEASEKRLRFIAESMPQKIYTMKPNGEPDYSNPQWEEYTGNASEPDTKKNGLR